MVHRALSDKTFLSLGLLSPLSAYLFNQDDARLVDNAYFHVDTRILSVRYEIYSDCM